MPIQQLLAQVESEYEALQSKYEGALVEVRFLRACLASKPLDVAINGRGGDFEAAQPLQQFSFEALHGAPPVVTSLTDRNASQGSRSSGTRQRVSIDSGSMRNTDYLNVRGGSFSSDHLLPQGNSLSDITTRFLRNPVVETLLVLIVVSNVVVMVFETDMRAETKSTPLFWEVLGWVYLLMYLAEFILRVVAYQRQVFADKWTRLDFAVIVVDVVSILMQALLGNSISGGFNASMFRLLRAFRLVKVFKVLRFVKELQLLIHGFSGAMRAVFWATGMLEVMVLIWSLVYVEILYPRVLELLESGKLELEQCPRCDVAYSSVWNSHNTIWQQVIAGDSWGLISLDVMTYYPLLAIIYIGCLMSTQFAMLNLIFTVIVDAAIRAREDDQQQKLVEKENSFQGMRDKLVALCKEMDADNSRELTLEELVDGYENNKEFADTMASLDITLDDVSTLFMIMDEDRSGAVSYMEFVNNIYKMKEQDVHTMLMFVKGYVIDLRFKMKEDVTSLLKDNLRQAAENAKHMDSLFQSIENMMQHADRNVSGSQPASGQQNLEALVQHVEDLVADTQNASGSRHMEAMVQHVENLVAGTQNTSARRYMEAMVKHVEELVAGTQGVSGQKHMEALVKHVEDLVAGTQDVSSQKHMEAMVKHVEELVAGTQGVSSQKHMEALVKHVEELVAGTQGVSSQKHMEALVKHVEDLVAGTQGISGQKEPKEREVTAPSSNERKELAFILEAQADILRALQKKRLQTPKSPLHTKSPSNSLPPFPAAYPTAAPHLVVQPDTVPPYLAVPRTLT